MLADGGVGLAGPLADGESADGESADGEPAADGDWLAGDVADGDAQPVIRITAPSIRPAALRRNAGPGGRLSVNIIRLGRSVARRWLGQLPFAAVHGHRVPPGIRAMTLAAPPGLHAGSSSWAAQSFAVPAGRQPRHRLSNPSITRAYVRRPA